MPHARGLPTWQHKMWKEGDKMRKTILVLTLLAWYQYKKSNLFNITSKFNVSDYNKACQFYGYLPHERVFTLYYPITICERK